MVSTETWTKCYLDVAESMLSRAWQLQITLSVESTALICWSQPGCVHWGASSQRERKHLLPAKQNDLHPLTHFYILCLTPEWWPMMADLQEHMTEARLCNLISTLVLEICHCMVTSGMTALLHISCQITHSQLCLVMRKRWMTSPNPNEWGQIKPGNACSHWVWVVVVKEAREVSWWLVEPFILAIELWLSDPSHLGEAGAGSRYDRLDNCFTPNQRIISE